MKNNHLTTASKYIDKQITSLVLEQTKLKDKAAELTAKVEMLESQIQGLYASKKSLDITRGAGDDYPIIDLNK